MASTKIRHEVQSMSNPTVTPNVASGGGVRQKALQQELRELVDVVGPGPLVDLLLERAFQLKATDIHLDPVPDGLRVRLRVDGLLHDVLKLPAEMQSHVVSRIKLMAGMDITERRLAQDGHIANAVLRQQRDIRVGSGPTAHGERLVLRLMPDQSTLNKLEDLGFDEEQIDLVRKYVGASYGMILSVGPVGSGKSTTMYSCLEVLNDPGKSLVTIEDPIERRVEGVNQIQVDPRIEFGFVEALRGVLRQDPNVIMVGEIRDPETAHIGCRAGLTGVTVLSTLHANDTASTIDVFREFGIPPMFIADSLQCIVSQRLLRKVCTECRQPLKPDHGQSEYLGLKPGADTELYKGVGCDACFNTGYSGRTGVFEIMGMTDTLRDAILGGKSHNEIMDFAVTQGMTRLEDAAKARVRNGVTSIEEIHRVLTTFA
jgi:type II secretory ATPase GspE/PulE/Tfp pilus assembly ATPase PilB-like protein